MIKMKSSGVEWIGEIPEDWEVSRVKNFLSERTGGAWGDEKKNNANDIICLRIADFDYSRFKFNNSTELTIRNYNTDIIEKLLLKKDDILVEKSGGGDKTPVGRAVIFEKTYKALFANFMDRLRVRNNISALFFLYVWTTYYDNKYMLPYVKQTTGIQNLDITSILSGVFFPLPSKSTQQRIATYLDKKCSKIEETIQNQQQVIEKLKAYKQSLITEAVTGKIKIENGKACGEYESYKDSGVEWIGKIPSEWISTRVGHLYKSMLGKMVCPNQLTEEHSLQKYLCAMNVHFDGVDLSEIKEMWFTPNEMNQYQVRNGDLLVVEGGAGAGGASIICGLSEDDKIFIQNSIHLVKPVKTDYLPKYLYYWIYSLVKQNYIDYTCNKATIPHFTKEKLERMPIAISDKKTQQEIIDYLEKKCTTINIAIEQKQKLIEKLTEYKKSLIYECVTGKKEVN